jgi:hypothetical protein
MLLHVAQRSRITRVRWAGVLAAVGRLRSLGDALVLPTGERSNELRIYSV